MSETDKMDWVILQSPFGMIHRQKNRIIRLVSFQKQPYAAFYGIYCN